MKQLWLRWALLAVFVVALSITFVNLGQWQLDRLDQRRDRNASVVEHEAAPVVDYQTVFGGVITEADQWQRVRVRGVFDAEHQLQVRYRSQGDQPGWELVTPLTTTEGSTLLVNRGFVVRPSAEDFPKVLPEPPAGEVEIVGYVRRNEQGKENATTPNQGTVRLINSDAIGAWLGRPVLNGHVALLTVTPGQSGELLPIALPALDEGPHQSYALQWFAFTAIAGIGLLVLIRNDIKDRKRDAATLARRRVEKAAAGDSVEASAQSQEN